MKSYVLEAVSSFLTTFIGDLVIYSIFCLLIGVIFYRLGRQRLLKFKVIPSFPRSSMVKREIHRSVLSFFVMGLFDGGISSLFLYYHPSYATRYLRLDGSWRTWGHGLVTFIALVLIYDAYFYWTHRLLHLPSLYKRFHRQHHESINPTAWAAFNFSPLEALINGAFFSSCFFIPIISLWGFLASVLFIVFRNALGHAGYEVFPVAFQQWRLTRQFTVVTHHIFHHSKAVGKEAGNYGLIFTWWDRWMGTENRAYLDRYYEIKANAHDAAARNKNVSPINREAPPKVAA